MKHLKEGIKALHAQELKYARKDHGEFFCELADGYLALAEEVQEAHEEWGGVQASFSGLLATYRREKRVDAALLAKIERRALLAACELVQVATVARKMMESEGLCGNGEKSLHQELS